MQPQPPARFDISAPDIARVVAAFYAQVRQHPELAPVFAAHVTDWPAHEAKIAAFWRNVIQHERAYSGNPQVAHGAAPEIRAEHFAVWLARSSSERRCPVRERPLRARALTRPQQQQGQKRREQFHRSILTRYAPRSSW